MKVLDVDDFHRGTGQIQKQLTSLDKQIEQLQKAVNEIVSLDESLKGNMGESIRNYFHEIHQPFLLYFQNFLANYDTVIEEINSSLKQFEPTSNGYIHEGFLDTNIPYNLKTIKTATESLTKKANQRIRQVNDIVHLPALQDMDTLFSIEDAQKKAEKTLEMLKEFDHQAKRSLDKVAKDLYIMIRYIEQMQTSFKGDKVGIAQFSPTKLMDNESYRSLLGESVQKLSMTPIKTIKWEAYGDYKSVKYHVYENGVIVMEYTKVSSDGLPYYEVVTEIPEEKKSENEKPTFEKIMDGIYSGAGRLVEDTIDGLKWTIEQVAKYSVPNERIELSMEIGRSLTDLILHPKQSYQQAVDVGKYMVQAVKDGFEKNVINGGAESRADYFTYFFGTIAVSVVGDKGASKVGQTGKLGSKLGEGISKLKPTINTPSPVLSAAGVGSIPYNTMDNLLYKMETTTKEVYGDGGKVGKIKEKGVETKGYKPVPGERVMTKEEWRVQDRDRRIETNYPKPHISEKNYDYIKSNPKYYNSDGQINWPPSRGVLGKTEKIILKPGTIIDRFGYEGGTFVSPYGVPYEMRALAPETYLKPYQVYVVKKPIEVETGKIAPWFDEPGLGIQYELNQSVKKLIDDSIIGRVGK